MPRMEQLIPVVNKLQDVFNTVGDRDVIQLPQIVVVGAQSSGKSSVMENIVGRDFLPRGAGIVTRVPLIMQLIQRTGPPRANEPKEEEWAQFLHCPDKIYIDFEEVRKEIDARTIALVGDAKNVSDKPIHLKIFSSHVLNLTLVDLPGITKVPVGNQPKDIEKQIRELVLHYIGNPNSIILAVSPANSDLANSDAIKIAQEVDPNGDRTIAVITKLDLMDRGTDATEVLLGNVIPVKLGLIGVVNRSQYDIDHKKNIKDAAKAEADFFSTHYPALVHRCGIPFLAKTLNKVLMLHIRRCLPDLKQRIRNILNRTQQAMNSLGAPLHTEDHGAMLLQVLTKFSESYRASINGTSMDLQTTELCGGARIFHIFKNIFGKELEDLDPLQGLEADQILTAIRNASGTRSTLFIPEISFEFLAKRQIARLESPSLRCIQLVSEEMERLITLCIVPELNRFRLLRDRIIQTTNELLRTRMDPTTKMVENLIAIEVAYINTTHPDFEGTMSTVQSGGELGLTDYSSNGPTQKALQGPTASQATKDPHKAHPAPPPFLTEANGSQASSTADSVSFLLPFWGGRKAATQSPVPFLHPEPLPEPIAAPQPANRRSMMAPVAIPANRTSKQTREVEMMRTLIVAYFAIARKRIQDTIPKAIMHFMVNYFNDQLQNELVRSLYKPDHLGELLEEDSSLAAQRQSTQEMLSALQRASVIVTEVSDADLAV